MKNRAPLNSDTTAEEAFITIALDASEDFIFHLNATMKDDDAHGPHQARVALRRLRTLLKAYEPILDPEFVDDLKDESRRLFLQLGHIRDADILLAAADSEDERDKRQTVAREIRETSRRRLARDDASDFANRLEARLEKKGWRADSKRAKGWRRSPVGVLAGNALDQAWEEIHPTMPLDQMKDRRLHDLRKHVKSIRYMTEFFGPAIDRGDWRTSLEAMKDLQDTLGKLTDMALARKLDDTVRPSLIQEASVALDRVFSLGPWWHADRDLAQDGSGMEKSADADQ